MMNMKGRIGTVAQDALADLIVINGNLLENISVLKNSKQSIALIMKNGNIIKNEL